MSLRKKIADSPALNAWLAGLFMRYIRWVHRTTAWDTDGWDEVEAALAVHGAVIVVGWHQRVLMAPYMFDLTKAPCRSLTSKARAGRLAGQIHKRGGYESVPMYSDGPEAVAALRTVLKGLRKGVSIAIAADGPRGPARQAKPFPLVWARGSRKPVFVFAFSTRRFWAWPTWDRMMFALPYGQGAMIWRRWQHEVPPTLPEAEIPGHLAELNAFMDEVTEEADRMAGHAGPCL